MNLAIPDSQCRNESAFAGDDEGLLGVPRGISLGLTAVSLGALRIVDQTEQVDEFIELGLANGADLGFRHGERVGIGVAWDP